MRLSNLIASFRGQRGCIRIRGMLRAFFSYVADIVQEYNGETRRRRAGQAERRVTGCDEDHDEEHGGPSLARRFSRSYVTSQSVLSSTNLGSD